MSNKEFPFRVGFCLCCGDQSMIPHPNFGPIVGMKGTKVCWICLCDDGFKPVTRIGTVTFCKNCDLGKIGTEEEIEKMMKHLEEEPRSGFNLLPIEAALPHKKLELVKTFGD